MIDVHIIRDKLVEFEREISSELGPFSLFTLVLQDNDSGSWDVLVSARWFEEPQPKNVTMPPNKTWGLHSPKRVLFYDRFVKAFTLAELVAMTGAIQLPLEAPFVRAFIERVRYETGGTLDHGMLEFTNWTVDHFDLLRGYVITANGAELPPPPAPRVPRKRKTAAAV